MLASSILSYFENNWGWAAGLAAGLIAVTALCGGLLNRQRKDDVALWLMGAHTEQGWVQNFNTLFDSVFGHRHLTLRCFRRSAIASVISVVLVWLLIGSAESAGLRLQANIGLGSVLFIGLIVNVIADYLSLVETRILLAHMPRGWVAQVVVLIFDLLVSAAIIWFAIFIFLRSPWHQGEIDSFAEIIGVFSVYSVFFYSTFLTSVWVWAFIASTWLMRIAKYLRFADWLDVEHRPILILSNFIGVVTFVGALALSGVLSRDEDGLTLADRAVCSAFKGRVCLDVAALTSTEQAQLDLIALACEGGITEECMERAYQRHEVDSETAKRLWIAACRGGDPIACTNVGHMAIFALGVEFDPATALDFSRRGCEGGDPGGCVNLGNLMQQGIGVDQDILAANTLFRQACSDGNAFGCTNAGFLSSIGAIEGSTPSEAVQYFMQGCDGGHSGGCANLGVAYADGFGVERDTVEAQRLFDEACELGFAQACEWSAE